VGAYRLVASGGFGAQGCDQLHPHGVERCGAVLRGLPHECLALPALPRQRLEQLLRAAALHLKLRLEHLHLPSQLRNCTPHPTTVARSVRVKPGAAWESQVILLARGHGAGGTHPRASLLCERALSSQVIGQAQVVRLTRAGFAPHGGEELRHALCLRMPHEPPPSTTVVTGCAGDVRTLPCCSPPALLEAETLGVGKPPPQGKIGA
jgi:hypothetical protein